MSLASAAVELTSTVLGSDDPPSTHDVRSLTTKLRMVKSPAEIALIQKATDASIGSQLAGMRAIRPGARERPVTGVEVGTMLAEGCRRASYPAIVGSGIHSTTLHYSETAILWPPGRDHDRCRRLILDVCQRSDVGPCRRWSLHRTAKEIYNIVLGAQQAARDAFVAGSKDRLNWASRSRRRQNIARQGRLDYINSHGKICMVSLWENLSHTRAFRGHRCARPI